MGEMVKISGLYWNAVLKSSLAIERNIRLIPQPGQWSPVTVWNMQGIPKPTIFTNIKYKKQTINNVIKPFNINIIY